MPNYDFFFKASGKVRIQADTMEAAQKKYDGLSSRELLETIDPNSVEDDFSMKASDKDCEPDFVVEHE